MIPGLKKNEIWQVIRPTMDPFGVWSMLLQQKASTKKDYLVDYQENSKESLLANEVSRHRWKASSQNPADVPRGSVAVYVGSALRRYVIPTTYLSLPEFRVLMEKAAEEFGFDQKGGLKIPCEQEDFEEVLLKCLATQRKMKKGKK